MSGDRLTEDRQSYYKCGNCLQRIDYLSTDEPPIPCPECGYSHKSRRIKNVPPKVKIDLTQY